MYNLVKKNNMKILVSLISLMILFLGLTFLVRKGNNSLTERQRKLMQYDQVQAGDEAVSGTSEVTFDAFFLEDIDNDGQADGIRGNSLEIGKTGKLEFEIKVTGDVKLTNGKIKFVNSNVKVSGTIVQGSLVSTTQSSTDFSVINIKELGNGTTIPLTSLTVSANLTNDLNSYSGVNKIILTGTVHNNITGEDTDIEKEVPYTVDWYGDKLKAKIYSTSSSEPFDYEHNTVTYTIRAQETEGQLFLKTAYLEATISQLNGTDPTSVTIEDPNVTYNYDPTTRVLTARRDAVLDDTLITRQAYNYKNGLSRYNDWKIKVAYSSCDACEILTYYYTNVNATVWYDAFNNQGNNYDTVKTSNKASRIVSARYMSEGYKPPYGQTPATFSSVTVGRKSDVLNVQFVDKTEAMSIYNGADIENSKTDYTVNWKVIVPAEVAYNAKDGLYAMKLDDVNGDRTSNDISLKPYTDYKTILFTDLNNNVLSTNGYIILKNKDTGEVIHIFTALDWDTPYTFDSGVKSIELEIGEFKEGAAAFNVYLTKTIDNNLIADNINFDDFEAAGNIISELNVSNFKDNDPLPIRNYDNHSSKVSNAEASYLEATSRLYITSSKSQIYTTEKSNIVLNIQSNNIDELAKGFKDGELYILFPEGILDVEINSIDSSDSGVTIVRKEIGTLDNGQKFIKILTNNTDPKKLNINVDVTVTPDITKVDSSTSIDLYGYNPICHNYLSAAVDTYDINSNNDTTEKVAYAKVLIDITAPNEIFTSSVLKEYSGSSITVAPMIAEVNPVEDDPEATIEISVTNNSGFAAKNVKVIGKVAYDDNTYQIGTGSLGSEYDVHMTDDGITYPSELDGDITIYYSEEETPTDDVNDASNGWKEKANTDFTKVKTYMIVINPDHEMAIGDSYVFSYDVEMPMTTQNLNKATYFTHGVYFDLITPAGLYGTSVGGSKLGIKMSRIYDVELTDLKAYSNQAIAGTKYLFEDEDGNQKTLVTDNNGKLTIKNLYVGKEYTLKQISIKSPYVLDEETKTFKIVNGANDVLAVNSNGTLKTVNLVNDGKLELVQENETRYNLVLTNTDLDTDASIFGTKFKITGKGYESGINLYTDMSGKLNLKDLYINETYEIEQVSINKYLLTDKFTVRLMRDSNNDVKISIAKVPSIGTLVNRTNSFDTSSDSDGSYYTHGYYSYRWYEAYIPIDLTGLTGTYKLTVPYKYYSSNSSNNLYFSLTDSTQFTGLEFLSLAYDTSDEYTLRTAETTKYFDTNEADEKNLVGGRVYYLHLREYKYGWGTLKIYAPIVELTNGDPCEYEASATDQNVPTFENQYALQTVVDDGINTPVLTVNVKNKRIPSYTLEINKVNAETNEPLAGAQYKITGPGLPAEGKYLTTDANGKASIELYKKLISAEYNYTVINGIDYSQYDSEYTIEEIVAPIGYTLDSKKITFVGTLSLQNGTIDYNTRPSSYNTDLATENNNVIGYPISSEAKFKEAQWDNTNNTLKVTLHDYPIIKITKKDAETGEVLPNTLFAINAIQMVNGQEILLPAFNSKGEVVGNLMTIDNKDYNIVQTDNDGKINLDLAAGQYKLKEIQAADDKYEVSTAEYYFGVGETVPYQGPGVEIEDTLSVPGYPTGAYESLRTPKYLVTDDGSIVYMDSNNSEGGYFLVKKDSDGNIEWRVDALLDYGNGFFITYFDDPDRKEWVVTSKGKFPPYALTQASDGGYFVADPRNGLIAKYSATGQKLWQNQNGYYFDMRIMDKVCTYEGNTDANGHVRLYEPSYDGTNLTWMYKTGYVYDPVTYESTQVEYFDISASNPDTYNSLDGAYLRDDNTYYCHLSYTPEPVTDLSLWQESSWNQGEYNFNGHNRQVNTFSDYENSGIVALDDGGVLLLYSYPRDEIMMADGTEVNINWNYTLIKYDVNGNIVAVSNLDEIIYNAEEAYLQKYNLNTGHKGWSIDRGFVGLKLLQNGDILLVGTQNGALLRIRYNEITNNYEPVFFSPMGVNGKYFGYMCSSFNRVSEIKLTDDGGFIIGFEGGCTGSPYVNIGSNSYNEYYDTELQQLELNPENSYNTFDPVFEYDANGKLKNIVIAAQNDSIYAQYPDIYNHLYGYNAGASYAVLPDGNYLFTMATGRLWASYNSGYSQPSVILANGELELIDSEATFLVYLVNKDSKIEWIRQYKGIRPYTDSPSYSYYYNYIDSYMTGDGKYWLLPALVDGDEFEDLETGTVYQAAAPGGVNFVKIRISDAIQPSGPEAYTLNIENKRKEYKVTATSNLGGEVVVTNPDNGQNVISTTGATTTLEKVKYGDTNKYDITIIPAPTYIVAGVRVNGEDIAYTVNPDGSVTLSKIEDIKEDKNISIIYDRNKAQVIVKHYLKGTTESVFGDEIIIGDIDTPYETEPKSSDLYSLATDTNGEIILPSNMTGDFAATPITVIYYYQENEVELKVNYYVDGTETELAPTNIQRKVIGSTYQTAPLNIDNYEYTRTIGEPQGTLDRSLTEVTFMYQQSSTPDPGNDPNDPNNPGGDPSSTDSIITIRYVDRATNQDIIPKVTKTVTKGSNYTTDDPVSIPAKYRQVGTPANATGTANDANIEVIYYYEEIPFNVSVDKKINSILLNGEKQTFTNSKNVSISPAKTDNLIVYYEINLKNTGDIKANFTVVEGDIPGFVIYDKGNFTETNNGYELVAELEPGEEKTYRIGYKWNQKDYGISTNKVELKEVTNDKGFAEPNAQDNISTATIETKIPKAVLGEPIEIIPNTLDNIPTMIGLLIASIIGIMTSLILIRKKRMN